MHWVMNGMGGGMCDVRAERIELSPKYRPYYDIDHAGSPEKGVSLILFSLEDQHDLQLLFLAFLHFDEEVLHSFIRFRSQTFVFSCELTLTLNIHAYAHKTMGVAGRSHLDESK